MGLLPRGGGGGGGNGEGCGCGGGVNIGIVMGADGKPSAHSSPDLEAVKKELAKKADLVDGKVPPEQLPPGGTGPSVDIINALDSDRMDAALSAAQGKELDIRLRTLGERTFVVSQLGANEPIRIPGNDSNLWIVQLFVTFDSQPGPVPNAVPAYSCVFDRGEVAPVMAAGTGFLIKGGQTLPMQALVEMRLIDLESFHNAAAYFIFVGHLVS